MSPSIEFLKQVLGEDGQKAFEKAEARVPTIGAALVPRAVISWLSTAVRVNYEGIIPGLSNSYITLQKSDRGFTGAITVGEHVHAFEQADMLHVAAAIALSLGLEGLHLDPRVKSTDISKLGKSIDLLVKARVVAHSIQNDLVKNFAPSPVFKIELPGKAAAPKEPKEADGPQTPMAVAPSTNKQKPNNGLAKTKELVIKKTEAEHPCPECGLTQFRRDRFVGCICFRALAKSVTTKVLGTSYTLVLPRATWDEETTQTLMQALKG